jgi:predicted nucleic acid-binding protein
MAAIFLDANVFLYAMGTAHPERKPCIKLLDLVSGGRIEAVTSSEVLQEVLYVRLKRGAREQAFAAVRSVRDMVDEVLPVTGEDVLEACQVLSENPALDCRDAMHAAVARRYGITSIATVDRDFENIKGLRRLTPAQAAA